MRTLVSLLLLFSISLTFGQKTIYKEYKSEILNDTRDLSIYLPKSYDKDSISNFPLAIVLDGHKLFDVYVGASNYYAELDHAPEQIVVGIDMKDSRNKDAGYDIISGNLDTNSKNFYRFIRDEMIPYIEATFKTSPFLTIVGESLTANYITHFLQEEYSIFNAYICLNPTLSNNINNQMESYKLQELSSEDNTFYFYLSSNPFSNTKKKDKIRNLIDNKIYNIAIKKKIKILGICHGAQFLAKKFGFKLQKEKHEHNTVCFPVSGICFLKNTPVYTNQGFVEIGDLDIRKHTINISLNFIKTII